MLRIIRCQNPQVEATILLGTFSQLLERLIRMFLRQNRQYSAFSSNLCLDQSFDQRYVPKTPIASKTPTYRQGERKKCVIRSEGNPRKQNQNQQNKPSTQRRPALRPKGLAGQGYPISGIIGEQRIPDPPTFSRMFSKNQAVSVYPQISSSVFLSLHSLLGKA